MKKKYVWIWIVASLWMSVAKAALYVEIKGGQGKGLPIAIVPFQGEGEGASLENLSAIVQADLANSGQFSAVPASKMRQFPHQIEAVQCAYWKSLGVENLVIGQVEKEGGGYRVQFELLDVIRERGERIASKPLLSMQFNAIRAENLRALAHHISDRIFEKLIGIKGVFSTRIAYISVQENAQGKTHTLEVADADGHHPKALYRSRYPLMSPSWSPDGKRIAFVSFENDRASIQVAEVKTGMVQRVTQFPGINGAPTWSPDNHTLALVLSKDGSPKIYTLDLNTKALTRLTEGGSIDTEPSFAPDGRSIVFTSNRGGKPQIYRVTLGGGKVERLTFVGNYNAKPSLTPDGKRLVMLHRGEAGLFSIAVQNLLTGDVKTLTQASLNDSPSLAPNGMMVLYGVEEGDRGVLGAVSLDGRVRIRLPSREGNVQEPAWSPFASS